MKNSADIPGGPQDQVAQPAPAPSPTNTAVSPVSPAGVPKTEAMVRDARLKAALKANMARRKGQARARAGVDAGLSDPNKNE